MAHPALFEDGVGPRCQNLGKRSQHSIPLFMVGVRPACNGSCGTDASMSFGHRTRTFESYASVVAFLGTSSMWVCTQQSTCTSGGHEWLVAWGRLMAGCMGTDRLWDGWEIVSPLDVVG